VPSLPGRNFHQFPLTLSLAWLTESVQRLPVPSLKLHQATGFGLSVFDKDEIRSVNVKIITVIANRIAAFLH
jgi:hypothetical protein